MSRFSDRLSRVRWKRLTLVVGGGGTLLALSAFGIAYAATDIPKPSEKATAEASRILYADGGEIGRIGKSNRELVTIEQIPDGVQKAVLAAEDRGFYTEPGISPKGILRALVTNVKGGGGIQQGGSTITQQYAKNAFLTQERTYTRKVKEVFIALKMSRTVEKDQVLEDYLNTIYFGRGADGIQVAAKTFFGKTVDKLSTAEGAVLAATIRSPAAYDPTRHPERAEDRFQYVLGGMVEKGWLTQAERDTIDYPKVLAPGKGRGAANNDRSGPKGYILEMVEEELGRRGFGEDRLAAGGLVVQTTIRREAQAAAVKAVEDAVPLAKDNTDPVAGLVSIKPDTGEVFAYVGGRVGNGGTDYSSGETRQPGSSFKAYALAAALEDGQSLRTRYDGRSPQEICGQKISNDEGDPPLGRIDLVKSTELSVNTVYFRLACEVGPEKIADLAHRAGIPDDVSLSEPNSDRPAAGIALGQYAVHVIDQAAGYATIANGGDAIEPYFVKKIVKGDEDVYEGRVEKNRAIEKDVAADVTVALQAVVDNGTGTRARLDGWETAGKTGTTSDNKDAWFVGYTTELATAVWLGRPDRQPMRGILGVSGGIYGGRVPAEIFKSYMQQTHDVYDLPKRSFPERADVGKDSAPREEPRSTAPTATSTSPTASPTALVPTLLPGEPTQQPTQRPTQQPTQPPPPSSPPPQSPAPQSPAPQQSAGQQSAPSEAPPAARSTATPAPTGGTGT